MSIYLETRTAHALNSAVPDFGSDTSIVSRFVVTSSGKWSVMNTMPARRPGSILAGARTHPRREEIDTRSPSAIERHAARIVGVGLFDRRIVVDE